MSTDPLTLSLREIASWNDIPEITERPEIRASVPILQRGLVWNPDQIELLWDSILRGFPIGSLVLSTRIPGQEKESDAKKQGANYHLLDGQQRCDAIALGFKDPFRDAGTDTETKKTEPILWLDLNPPDDKWSTRQFVVRLTTPSHPWGYTRSDSATKLNVGTIRDALKEIGIDTAAERYVRPTPSELWPLAARAPIPLAWLLLGSKKANLWENIKNRMEHFAKLPWCPLVRAFLEDKGNESQRAKIYDAIKRIETTRIVALCAPDDLLVASRQEGVNSHDGQNISSIEHLFQRLNQKGTPLDGEELAYSMIKAYWPELATPIDGIADKRLPATRLISLGIRTALSSEDRKQLQNGLGVSGIRAMAQENNERTKRVLNYIKNELRDGCSQIEAWLRYDKDHNPSGLLPVHIGSIAKDSPDIFLLLLTFAKRTAPDWEQAGEDWPKRLQALATIAHWFGVNTSGIANKIYAACVDQISPFNIRQGLAEANREGYLRPIHHPDVVGDFLRKRTEKLENWNWNNLLQINETEEEKARLWNKWGEFLWFREQSEMLLYAQRDFIQRRFSDYDPARKDFWKGHNRPWDFDHILAWMFVNNRKDGGPYRETAKEWAKTIGNLRAWPFEDNRSEQAMLARDKLSGEENESRRHDSFVDEEELEAFSGGDKVRWERKDAYDFVEVCRERLLRIYRAWYESVAVAALIPMDDDTSPPPSEPTTMIASSP